MLPNGVQKVLRIFLYGHSARKASIPLPQKKEKKKKEKRQAGRRELNRVASRRWSVNAKSGRGRPPADERASVATAALRRICVFSFRKIKKVDFREIERRLIYFHTYVTG